KPKPISTANLADLWEKGILQTITNKLQEMKRLRDQIENVIDKKIEKSLQKETKKMDALLKSQQTLVLAKMNAALDDKTKEVSELIDAKIKELKKIREEKEKTISSMDIKQDMVKETFSKLSEELEGTQKERKKSLENFNASLIKVKSQFEETIEDARQKLVALEERATQTLELETAIIDGMVKESQSRIDQMALEKVDDLTSDVREALTELEALKVGLDVEEVNKQIGEIKQAKQKLDSQLESAVESVASHIEARIEKELKSRLRELDQEYQQIVKNVSVEIIKKDLDELKALKKELKQELARFRGTQ
ncbi:hypothetical protein KJ972_01300, partial [Candidatus Micrarchaeota archaeon]|nr:hypothetical protein [Candidatus Micrarchaeota archaeon]